MVSLLVVLSVIIILWAYLVLSNPPTERSFSIAHLDAATEEISLFKGDSVLLWLSTIPAEVGGQGVEECVIKVFVTDPTGHEVLEPLGVAGRIWLWPLSFLAQQDGVYTMHFENSMGSSITKTVSLSYKTTLSAFGIPLEHLLLYVSITVGTIVLVVIAAIFLRTRNPLTSKISESDI